MGSLSIKTRKGIPGTTTTHLFWTLSWHSACWNQKKKIPLSRCQVFPCNWHFEVFPVHCSAKVEILWKRGSKRTNNYSIKAAALNFSCDSSSRLIPMSEQCCSTQTVQKKGRVYISESHVWAEEQYSLLNQIVTQIRKCIAHCEGFCLVSFPICHQLVELRLLLVLSSSNGLADLLGKITV